MKTVSDLSAAYGGERTVLHRQKKPVAAVIPIEEYEFLERAIEAREDEIDIRTARRVRKEKGGITSEAPFQGKLGLPAGDAPVDRSA